MANIVTHQKKSNDKSDKCNKNLIWNIDRVDNWILTKRANNRDGKISLHFDYYFVECNYPFSFKGRLPLIVKVGN